MTLLEKLKHHDVKPYHMPGHKRRSIAEKIPYDIALVGDTINLANDDLRNFARCSITGSSAGGQDLVYWKASLHSHIC